MDTLLILAVPSCSDSIGPHEDVSRAQNTIDRNDCGVTQHNQEAEASILESKALTRCCSCQDCQGGY